MKCPRKAIASVVGLLALACAGLAAPGEELLILTPRDLAAAAEELAIHRRGQGLRVHVESVDPCVQDGRRDGRLTPEGLKALVAKRYAAGERAMRYLLLMGDAPSPGDAKGLVRIPPKILKADFVDERWPHPKELASDIWYGMIDADLVAEMAVGRLPADDLEEARGMVARILAYERDTDFGDWRKTLEIIAGTAGFGATADALIEGTFRSFVKKLIDPAYDVRITYANPESPFSSLPERFADKVLERFNAGSLVTAYVGHGQAHAFSRFEWQGKRYPIFRMQEARRIAVERGAPIALLIACSTGYFDHPRADCISEVMIKRPRGPIAVFSSTRISQPYADAIVGRALIDHLMGSEHERIGDVLQAVRLALARPRGMEQKIMDTLAGLIMRPETLAPCRDDHVHLYNLFGDPCLIVGRPRGKGTLRAPASATFGEEIEVACTLDRPYRGRATVTLEGKRGSLLRDLVPTAGLTGRELEEAVSENWRRANDTVLARTPVEVRGPGFSTHVRIPARGLPEGEYLLRFFLSDESGAALGSAAIHLREER